MIAAAGRWLPGPPPARGLRTAGTGGHARLARGVPAAGWRHVLRPRAGQQVKQVMAGAEIGRGGPDAPRPSRLTGRAGVIQPNRATTVIGRDRAARLLQIADLVQRPSQTALALIRIARLVSDA